MSDNLLHIDKSVTFCQECKCKIKGDPGRTICNECVAAEIKEAGELAIIQAVSAACGVIEKRELAEVVDINRFREKRLEAQIIEKMVEEAEALDW